MTEQKQEAGDRIVKVDRYSKVVALFFSAAVLGITIYLIDDMMFNMTVSAVAGIGIRFYIPYHATVVMVEENSKPVREFRGTGDYNHGAVGAALVIASFVAIGTMVVVGTYSTAMIVGAAVGAISYFELRSLLS